MAASMNLSIALGDALDAASWAEKLTSASTDPRRAALMLSNYFAALASGTQYGVIQQRIETGTYAATKASDTVTITHANISANDTYTVAGRVLTWKASASNENEVTIGASTATHDAENLVAKINAHSELSALVTASNSAGVVTITANEYGLAGVHITHATSDATAMALANTHLVLTTNPTIQSASKTYSLGA